MAAPTDYALPEIPTPHISDIWRSPNRPIYSVQSGFLVLPLQTIVRRVVFRVVVHLRVEYEQLIFKSLKIMVKHKIYLKFHNNFKENGPLYFTLKYTTEFPYPLFTIGQVYYICVLHVQIYCRPR